VDPLTRMSQLSLQVDSRMWPNQPLLQVFERCFVACPYLQSSSKQMESEEELEVIDSVP
jgi:hypothetical protein